MNKTIRIRAAGILVREGELLLVRHEKNGRSYWLFPGGGVDYGETAAAALRREFLEECGLAVDVGDLVLVHDSIPPDNHRQVLNLYFRVSVRGGELRPGSDGVLKDARFQPLGEVETLTVYPKVVPRVLEGIREGWAKGCRYLGNLWED